MRLLTFVSAVAVLLASGSVHAAPEKGYLGIAPEVKDGEIVIDVALNGPAVMAGVKKGDVLVRINDFKVKANAQEEDIGDIVKEVSKYKPGDTIKVTVKRDAKEVTIEVAVGKRPVR